MKKLSSVFLYELDLPESLKKGWLEFHQIWEKTCELAAEHDQLLEQAQSMQKKFGLFWIAPNKNALDC